MYLLAAQQGPDLDTVCGDTPSAYCRFFFERFGAFGPVVAGGVRIVLILVAAFIVSRVLRRVIKRFIRGLAGRGIERLGRLSDKAPLSDTAPIGQDFFTILTEEASAAFQRTNG